MLAVKKLKEKAIEVKVDFGRSVVLSGMSPPDEYPFRFEENGVPIEPTFLEIGASYSRARKGPKTVNRIRGAPGETSLDPNWNLIRFKTVVAVDTNTIEVGGTKVSVSASVLVYNIKLNAKTWAAQIAKQDAFEFHDSTIAPELIGWWEIIERASKSEIERPIGIITDYDLNSLARINSRKLPFIQGLYVPKGVEFIYASADTGKTEFIANAALSECDNIARRILDRIKSQGVEKDFAAVKPKESSWFTCGRIWTAPRKA